MVLAYIFGVIVTIVLGFLLILYFVQDRFIYSPNSPNRNLNQNVEGEVHPGERGLNYEDISIKTSDGIRLHGWFIKQNNPNKCPTIIFFHGIDGNMGARLPFIAKLFEMCKVNVLIASYRGYGFSEGSPSEEGIQRDAIVLYKAITEHILDRNDIDTTKVFLMGTSFGAAVTLFASSKSYKNFPGVIIENPFISLDAMIDMKIKVPLIRRLVLRNHWSNIGIIPNVTSPILILTSLADNIVPPEHSKTLYNAAHQAEFKLKQDFPDAKHKGIYQMYPDLYFKTINNFINKCLA